MSEARKSLLVLDDEIDALDLMRFIFEPKGYAVYTASEGEEALRILNEEMIAVAMVDLLMPGMSGRDFLARLKDLPPDRRPLVLVHSARRPEEIRNETAEFEVFGIIGKPFEIKDITALVEKACAASAHSPRGNG